MNLSMYFLKTTFFQQWGAEVVNLYTCILEQWNTAHLLIANSCKNANCFIENTQKESYKQNL